MSRGPVRIAMGQDGLAHLFVSNGAEHSACASYEEPTAALVTDSCAICELCLALIKDLASRAGRLRRRGSSGGVGGGVESGGGRRHRWTKK